MKSPRSIGLAILGAGASFAASRLFVKNSRDLGELSEAMDLGYSPENALPIAGQGGFPAIGDVDPEDALRSIVYPKVARTVTPHKVAENPHARPKFAAHR